MARVRDLWMRRDAKGKKTLRTTRYGQGKRWLAVWDEDGREVSKGFTSLDAAESAISNAVVSQEKGTYIPKANRDVQLRAMWPIWFGTKAGKSKQTRASYLSAWARIELKWGDVACAQISRSEVAAWLPSLVTSRGCKPGETKPLGEAMQRKVGIVLNALLDTAVDENVIPSNPIKSSDIPQQRPTRRRYLSVSEVDRLRAAMPGPDERLVVDVLTRTGVRPGEAFGFQVGDLNALRGRLSVQRDVDDSGAIDSTKSGRHRDVPAGGELLLDIEDAAGDRDRGDWLLLTPEGAGWTLPRWGRVWAVAIEAAGLGDLTTYELRHTAASLAIHSGANVKTVQRMLGHRSAGVTLDIYGHLWDEELDTIPAAMDAHMKAERARFLERRSKAQTEQGRNVG